MPFARICNIGTGFTTALIPTVTWKQQEASAFQASDSEHPGTPQGVPWIFRLGT